MEHPVWGILNKDKYVEEFYPQAEAMYAFIKGIVTTCGNTTKDGNTVPTMKVFFDMWNEFRNETFWILGALTHDAEFISSAEQNHRGVSGSTLKPSYEEKGTLFMPERCAANVRKKCGADMIQKRSEYTHKFIETNIEGCPDADVVVLQFIANFLYHGVPDVSLDDSSESVRSTFRAGYCYYFAVMLQNAFNRGEICWAAPLGHIVWVDTNGVPYDVEGVNNSECDYYIPISYLRAAINDFKHVPGVEFRASKEFEDVVIERYLKDTKQTKADECHCFD